MAHNSHSEAAAAFKALCGYVAYYSLKTSQYWIWNGQRGYYYTDTGLNLHDSQYTPADFNIRSDFIDWSLADVPEWFDGA